MDDQIVKCEGCDENIFIHPDDFLAINQILSGKFLGQHFKIEEACLFVHNNPFCQMVDCSCDIDDIDEESSDEKECEFEKDFPCLQCLECEHLIKYDSIDGYSIIFAGHKYIVCLDKTPFNEVVSERQLGFLFPEGEKIL